jgi:cell division cycle 20-like protein 1, cofactor of APC complex
LKWSFDERLLASGGNDNKLYVWAPNLRAGGGGREGSRVGVDNDPVCEFSDHIAAVKAVGWSPHQHGTLASGGGTADRYDIYHIGSYPVLSH